MQLFSADCGRYNGFFDHKKLKKSPQKLPRNTQFFFFITALSCPNGPNSCSKMWLIDQLYIKLGQGLFLCAFLRNIRGYAPACETSHPLFCMIMVD